MKKYYEYVIKNQEGNDLRLLAHRVSQHLKSQRIEHGVFAMFFDDNVVVRTKEEFFIGIITHYLKNEVTVCQKDYDVKKGDSLFVSIGFKDSNEDMDKIKKLNQKHSHTISNGRLLHTISQKETLPTTSEDIREFGAEWFHVEYKNKTIRSNVKRFLIEKLVDFNEEQLFNCFVYGVGCKKSYGISSLEIIKNR